MSRGENRKPGTLEQPIINRQTEGIIIAQGPGARVEGGENEGTHSNYYQEYLAAVSQLLEKGINVNQRIENDVKTRLVIVGQGAGAQVHNVERLQLLLRNPDQTTGDQEGANQPEEEFSLR